MGKTRSALLLAVLLGAMAVAACSPEAGRMRSGGLGGDIGIRGPSVDLHGQSNPYFETPRLAPAPAR